MANANNGGLLQEFRKKTLFKMSRYTSAPSSSLPASPSVGSSSMPSSPAWEDIERQEILEARTRYFLVLMKRFQEQDCSLRQLEAELGDMLVQIQSACGAMTRAVEVFTQTFRYDASSYKLGVDYLAAVKMIGRDGANMMDQSIRFTVLDPILARLERHNQLKARIQAWEQLYREYVDRQLSVEQMKGSIRSEKDERRRRLGVGLAELQMQLAQIQDEVTPQLGFIVSIM
uniref:BAR domain-containing protein n=1 Tax=Globisporangium ultimum (strain ATCC 200006 / CBS 805.95 / DAOM BR144) TaxID=431595 RepID=K3WGG3_GLOUD